MLEKVYMVSARCAAIYDGTNGAEIVAEFQGDVVSDDGETLVYADGGVPEPAYTATVGQYVCWNGPRGEGAGQPAVDELLGFPTVVIRTAEGLVSSDARIAAVESATPKVVNGTAAVGPLGGGANITVAVQLHSAMPSAGYTADAVVFTGISLLGDLSVTGVAVVDADTVNVTLHNGGLLALSGGILVTAVHK